MAKQNQTMKNDDIFSCWKLYFKMIAFTSTKISLMKCGSTFKFVEQS